MKCLICSRPAKFRWSPDLDIRGIGACISHKRKVEFAYLMLMQNTPDMYKDYVDRIQREWKDALKKAAERRAYLRSQDPDNKLKSREQKRKWRANARRQTSQNSSIQ